MRKQQDTLKIKIFQIFSSIFLLVVLLYFFEWNVLLSCFLTVLYCLVIPKVLAARLLKKRNDLLEKEAIPFFEVFTLALKSGKTLLGALSFTTERLDSTFSLEVQKALEEIYYGKSFEDAILDLEKRISSKEVCQLFMQLRKSSQYGNDLTITIQDQIRYLKEKKKMELKALFAKIPIKVSVISVFFLLPLLLLLILSPVVIDYFIK